LGYDALTQIRRIGKIDVDTPLLIPSFSSVFDPKIGEIHLNLIDHIPDCSLVSAYDLAYNYINKENLWASNVVYIDSGNYEYENLKSQREGKDWSSVLYKRILSTVKPMSKVVIVNFDEFGSIDKQINHAKAFFQQYPSYASCFLCKPSQSPGYVQFNALIDKIAKLEDFDVIAFAEKELGASLIMKCENIIKIRQALISKGLNKPIHIFGCLDPLAIIVFFLCGADIFDGTNWLKFTFYDNLAIYRNNYAIIGGSWSDFDVTVRRSSYVFNLSKLTRLTQDMRRFTREGNLKAFNLTEQIQKQISELIDTAQVRKR
jgi:hypothetical protein